MVASQGTSLLIGVSVSDWLQVELDTRPVKHAKEVKGTSATAVVEVEQRRLLINGKRATEEEMEAIGDLGYPDYEGLLAFLGSGLTCITAADETISPFIGLEVLQCNAAEMDMVEPEMFKQVFRDAAQELRRLGIQAKPQIILVAAAAS